MFADRPAISKCLDLRYYTIEWLKAVFHYTSANLWYQYLCVNCVCDTWYGDRNRHGYVQSVAMCASDLKIRICIRLLISKILVKVILHLQCDFMFPLSRASPFRSLTPFLFFSLSIVHACSFCLVLALLSTNWLVIDSLSQFSLLSLSRFFLLIMFRKFVSVFKTLVCAV